MKKIFLFVVLLAAIQAQAIVKVDPRTMDWQQYIGQTVEFTEPLIVSGTYYDSIQLTLDRRLYVPERYAKGLAEGDSTDLKRLQRENQQRTICLQCKYMAYQVRTGSVILHLRAKVTGERHLLTGHTPKFACNYFPKHKPDMKHPRLLVCAANIQNYFVDLGGYASAKDQAHLELQTEKISKGLVHINADIYALCEVEKGPSSPIALCNAMNKRAGKNCYDWVNNGFIDGDTLMVCFIYRKDKVRPYGDSQYAYSDPASRYHYRLIAHAFEEIKTGARFCISLNHPRSKRGDSHYSDSCRMAQLDSVMACLNRIKQENLYGDEDILLVGDYNCHTMERPLQHLMNDGGYVDLLMRHDPDGYSYIWKGEAGYLDHVFCSPSMVDQVTTVHPYHLNADTYYSCGYKRGLNNTMYRYSDHDPILIGLNLKY